ncbi:TetR/AcrR family transcriptional regulator [Gordonia sp. TBRC 11910]|uniref:TetR/AcrR family transcriptional regulator n=1 Tax=Gordonia asplenii TaxID=2725283 RepID=A0A848L0W2_9ACTN|nr:TetR/AcrR family transcriptional regulator [Gordonia asplenii]NMO04339.1 TetR/AcrR family transcriptional regulator [Gordonia asplenii]
MPESSVNTAPAAGPSTLTARGRKTRDSVLAAARTVFEDVGFLDARVELIAQAAGVSYGTFYRYFESKEDVFFELSNQLFTEMHSGEPSFSATPRERLIAANHAYYEAYHRNAALMAIVEQVATFNAEFRALRHEHREQLTARTAHAIGRWQRDGLASPDIDPILAARTMSAMVDHTLYLWLVQGEEADKEALLTTLDQMCVGALGLR